MGHRQRQRHRQRHRQRQRSGPKETGPPPCASASRRGGRKQNSPRRTHAPAPSLRFDLVDWLAYTCVRTCAACGKDTRSACASLAFFVSLFLYRDHGPPPSPPIPSPPLLSSPDRPARLCFPCLCLCANRGHGGPTQPTLPRRRSVVAGKRQSCPLCRHRSTRACWPCRTTRERQRPGQARKRDRERERGPGQGDLGVIALVSSWPATAAKLVGERAVREGGREESLRLGKRWPGTVQDRVSGNDS